MRIMRSVPLVATVLACLSFMSAPRRAVAQEQIKPYLLLIFDTSGSMDEDPDGNGRTRMAEAKTAVNNIVNSTGDAVFGLMRFQQSCGPTEPNCVCNGVDTNAGTCRMPDPDGAGPLARPPYTGGELLVGIEEDNQARLLTWVNGGSCDYDTNGFELQPEGATPLGASLDQAELYFESGITNPWATEYGQAGGVWVSPIATDQGASPPVDNCRPYAVILLTDGEETCGATPANDATALRTTTVNGENYDVRTYVIAFGIDPESDEADEDIEPIAEAGGTDNPVDGVGALNAFYPADETALGVALSQIIQDSLLVEVCDGADNDCDLEIDEGVENACGSCGPLVEICNNADDDCDALTDEGFPRFCNRPGGHNAADLCADPGESVCDGIDDNCNGIIDEGGLCGGCTPSAEICDNLDNDCDGATDEGLSRACGTDVGECTAGMQNCAAGAWGVCSGVNPVVEQCDRPGIGGDDDDCNGVIDGMVEACGSDVGECQAGARRCDAGAWGACEGAIGAVAEICDGLDNDCDGSIDEGNPGGGARCGSNVGECNEGTYQCVDGELTCTDVGPTDEVCDGLDNDCDGLADDGNPEGGAACGLEDEGECEDGVEQCLGGDVVCIGGVGPSAEICDGRDNDCDTETDEGNPGGGAACGTDEGECEDGTLDCVGGELLCVGEVGPGDEICDLLDNDCDGATDEGIPVGAPCGTDVGECEPGNISCIDGAEDCAGGVGPVDEVCDGLDNDCDGATDEGLGLGEACGDSDGLCEPGVTECIGGEPVCVGEIGPTQETCDCDDEDCDGEVDEDPGICPGGSTCIDCSCRSPCDPSFEFTCPARLHCACEDLDGDKECEDGEFFCLGDRCENVECEPPFECDPATGGCVDPCAGVVCEAGLRCDGDSGRCLPDDCYYFVDDCGEDEVCLGGSCAPHPCNGVVCEAGEYCRAGACVGLCDDVVCGGGQKCVDGACTGDACAGTTCDPRDFCNPESGNCEPDPCDSITCPHGRRCAPTTGECTDDVCNVTVCPDEYQCIAGVCQPEGWTPGPDAGVPQTPARGLATGGGGFSCAVGGSGSSDAGSGLLGLVLALGTFLRRRKRRQPGAVAGGAR